jgi:hypothetical protein
VKVTGSDVRNGSLTGADIKNKSLRAHDIRNGDIEGRQIKNGSLTSSDIENGTLRGADFKNLPGTKVVVRRHDVGVPVNSTGSTTAECQLGEVAVGGGAGMSGGLGTTLIYYSEPLEANGTTTEDGDVPRGWRAGAGNGTGSIQTLQVHVLCAAA